MPVDWSMPKWYVILIIVRQSKSISYRILQIKKRYKEKANNPKKIPGNSGAAKLGAASAMTSVLSSTAGGMLLLRPRVIGSKPEALLDLAERKQDYLTEGPSQQNDEVEITLPAGVAADELPPPRRVATPAVSYSSESAFEKGTLRYKRRYEVHQYLVPRDRLSELNKAFAEILADERTSAVLK